MPTVQGDAAAIVAATLTQAEITLRVSAIDPSKANRLAAQHADHRGYIARTYEHYLALVTNGAASDQAPAG